MVFDDNSFSTYTNKTVRITASSFSKNFTVVTTSNAIAPSFTVSSSLTVSGDFILQENVVWSGIGTTTLQSSGNHVLDPAGVSFTGSFIVNDMGTRNLLGDFKALKFSLNSGAFNTNDHEIDLSGRFSSASSTTLSLGASLIRVNTWHVVGTVDAGTSHITVKGGSNTSGFTGNSATYYDVTFTSAIVATLRVHNGNFRSVEFLDSGTFNIETSHTFQNLKLASSSIYTFSSGRTQTITNTFTASNPDCAGLLELQSSTDTPAIIQMSTGGVVPITNARITGMTGTGATFNVLGIDNGGNSGWTFIEPAAKTLYWVGDALDGDWNNAANWASGSGDTGGYCVPTQFDDVIFDANSDASVRVTIATGNIGYCHNITVTGWKNGTLDIRGTQLDIYGANTWKNGMTYTVANTYYRSINTETLVFDGVNHNSITYFESNSNTGEWLFQDAFLGTRIYLNRGTLDTNSKDVYLSGEFQTYNTSNTYTALLLGASEINVSTWNLRSVSTLDAGTSHIITRGNGSNSKGGFQTAQGKTYYNVTLTNVHTFFNANNTSFNIVDIKGGATFNRGTKTYHTLLLAPAKVYVFTGGSTQIITDTFESNTPDCSGMTELRGTGISSKIIKANGTVHIPNAIMENMTAQGGATFTTTGFDLGGNVGWSSMESLTPKDLYWIGNSGDWNEGTNWTQNSDGTPSGGCVPTQFDNVFFNEYSGNDGITITITNTAAYCHNMTWLPGAPVGATLNGLNATSLEIYGSYTMGENMEYKVVTYFLSDDMGETLTSNGSKFLVNSVIFNGLGGWQFQDNAYFGHTLVFLKGTLDFGGNQVYADALNSRGAEQHHLNIEGSEFIVRTDLRYQLSNNTLSANGSTVSCGGIFSASGGLQWHDVLMNGTQFSAGSVLKGSSFNKVVFTNNVSIFGSNTFNVFEVVQNQRTISFENNTTQTIFENAYLSGTPCQPNTLKTSSGTQAKLDIQAGNVEFDYVRVQNINATGLPLTFHRNSTDDGGNGNITFLSGSGGLIGLGEDLLRHTINLDNTDTYVLDASRFFGGPGTSYSWTKLNDPDHTGVLGTGQTLDISTMGYGTYRVNVDYQGGISCKVSDDIVIEKITNEPITNETYTQTVCDGEDATVAKLSAEGQNIKWYATATATTPLPLEEPLVDGYKYYATQTIDDCESHRLEITVILKRCNALMITNPMIRQRMKRN